MTWDISITIHCECDMCNTSDEYDLNEPINDSDVYDYLKGMGWTFRDGMVLCVCCAERNKRTDVFLDRCRTCWHHSDDHCPQFKMSCENVYYNLYNDDDDAVCERYMPIGGKKDKTPKYKPTSASLDGFLMSKEAGA